MFGLPDGVTACLFDMDGVVTQTEHGADVVQDVAELLSQDGQGAR